MSATRPNIILSTTDQQRDDTIAALGAAWVSTPNLDRLVSEGGTFTCEKAKAHPWQRPV